MRFGKSKEDILGQTQLRKNEFNVLTKEIYRRISDKRYENNLPAYTVLLGDYNLNLNRQWTRAPYVAEEIEINDGTNTIRKLITVQDQLTTLKTKQEEQEEEQITELVSNTLSVPLKPQDTKKDNPRGFANNYDHMSYDKQRFEGVSKKVRRVDTVRKYYNDDFEKHRKEISDHIPIFMELDLTREE